MDTDNTVINQFPFHSEKRQDKRTYTVLEIAEILQVSRAKAYGLCSGDLFSIIRLGRSIRVLRVVFDEWLETFKK